MFVVTQRAKDQLALKAVDVIGGDVVDPDVAENAPTSPYHPDTDAHAMAEGHAESDAKDRKKKLGKASDGNLHAAPYGGVQEQYPHTLSPSGELAHQHRPMGSPVPGVECERLGYQPKSLAYSDMPVANHVSTGLRNGGHLYEQTNMTVPVRNFDARSAAMPGVTDFSAARMPMGPNQNPHVEQVAPSSPGHAAFVNGTRVVHSPSFQIPGATS